MNCIRGLIITTTSWRDRLQEDEHETLKDKTLDVFVTRLCVFDVFVTDFNRATPSRLAAGGMPY